MILSHAHADHLSGLVAVLEKYEVEKVLWNKQPHDSLLYREWEMLLEGVKSKKAYRGQRVDLGNAYLDVLYPVEDYDFSKSLNESSVINRLIHDDGAVLFMGDAYKAQENRLLEWEKKCRDADYGWCRVMEIPSEVLKVGHHGSSTSSDHDFIKKVSPEIALISAGKDNRYGHPHEKTMETFEDLGINLHKTFRDGNLRIQFE